MTKTIFKGFLTSYLKKQPKLFAYRVKSLFIDKLAYRKDFLKLSA